MTTFIHFGHFDRHGEIDVHEISFFVDPYVRVLSPIKSPPEPLSLFMIFSELSIFNSSVISNLSSVAPLMLYKALRSIYPALVTSPTRLTIHLTIPSL